MHINVIPNIAVLLTCFNRRKCTLNCLDALYKQQSGLPVPDVFLVDDGSTDGTAEAVKFRFPLVKIVKGNGSLFWNRGMHLAFQESIKHGYDFYLWLNDDTYLYPDALARLLEAYNSQLLKNTDSIIVGTTLDPDLKILSYGGYKRVDRRHPFRYALVAPQNDRLTLCDTMCGNCVLIPAGVVRKVGNINPVYHHRWGDVDYGLRARAAGCQVLVAPGYVGECKVNPQSEAWSDTSLSLRQRLKAVNSIKGLQKKDWKYYTRAHGGFFWFLFWLSPYLKIYLTSLSSKAKRYAG